MSQPPRVLIVDDVSVNRDLIGTLLRRQGLEFGEAEDGSQALARISDQDWDLVILDIMMPVMDGYETLRRIREQHSMVQLPVIVATSLDAREDIVRAFELGANDYITKPLDIPVVVARVQTQLKLKALSETKDEFLRIVSHDLKKPVALIVDVAQVLEDEFRQLDDGPGDWVESLQLISDSGRYMNDLIHDLLDMSALEDGALNVNLEAVDLNEVVKQVFTSTQPNAQAKGIDLSVELDGALPMVFCDWGRLTQVLMNLVSNATKFCSRGDSVRILTRVADGRVVVEVADTGPGLAESDLPKLFTKYARLGNKPTAGEHSSGLGLAICKQLIELQQGTIGARNNADGGATFWISVRPAAANT
jgi:signal transduction histidine kinase